MTIVVTRLDSLVLPSTSARQDVPVKYVERAGVVEWVPLSGVLYRVSPGPRYPEVYAIVEGERVVWFRLLDLGSSFHGTVIGVALPDPWVEAVLAEHRRIHQGSPVEVEGVETDGGQA